MPQPAQPTSQYDARVCLTSSKSTKLFTGIVNSKAICVFHCIRWYKRQVSSPIYDLLHGRLFRLPSFDLPSRSVLRLLTQLRPQPRYSTLHHGFSEPLNERGGDLKKLPIGSRCSCTNRSRRLLPHLRTMGCLCGFRASRQCIPTRRGREGERVESSEYRRLVDCLSPDC